MIFFWLERDVVMVSRKFSSICVENPSIRALFTNQGARVAKLTHFPADFYHKLVRPDLNCRESVGFDLINHELVGTFFNFLVINIF